jgi:ribonucleoside-diphosphate reductase alpha chain
MERDYFKIIEKKMYNYNQILENSKSYFKGDDLAASVFASKYALQDEKGNYLELTPDKMHDRLSKEFARIELKYPNPMSEEEIFSLFKDFKYIIPQGSPMSGIGNNYQIQSISNCFVIASPADSYGGILKTDQEQVQIMKRRGGVGFDVSNIRPKNLPTSNAAKTTSGLEVFLDRFSNSCREVAQDGRRGALMISLSVHHPQIRDFIKIKRDLTRVTGANISIRLSEEFMCAVRGGDPIQLRFPVDAKDPVIEEWVDARDLWHEIIESAHASAEPGLLFWDTAKSMTPSDIYEAEGFGSTSTNPCGEIILSPYDSCRLMLVNLTEFIVNQWCKDARFDYEEFGKVVQKAQRLMDDMIDLEIEKIDNILSKIDSDPEANDVKQPEKNLWIKIREQAVKGRRTGLGITGLGDALAMLGVTYGSQKSIEITEAIYKSLAVNSYVSSMIMAKERGAFEVHDSIREEDHPFLDRIFDAIDETDLLQDAMVERISSREWNRRWGRRNIANTTTAPAGSVSVLTQTTSGIEPAFMLHYTRRKKINPNDKDARVDFIDNLGDKWTEFPVYHHKFNEWMKFKIPVDEREKLTPEEMVLMSPYKGATANEINWVSKVDLQAAAQKWVCHAISNTTNLPSDIDVETVKQVYMRGWESGCKGITVYRDGSRSGVLVSNKNEISDDRNSMKFVDNNAPKRPESLTCDIHHVTIKGEKWTILIGLMEKRPYEVIGGLSKYVEIPKKFKSGDITRNSKKSKYSKYDLICGSGEEQFIIRDVVAVFDNPNYAGFTRTLSLALRHGAPIQYIVEQLQKDKEADLFSFSKVIARCLKNYIPDGTSLGDKTCLNCGAENSLVYQEGCVTCKSCGSSKCS